jgi:hypothetical protein
MQSVKKILQVVSSAFVICHDQCMALEQSRQEEKFASS